MQNLLEELKATLQSDERLIVDGHLVKNKVVELALAMDEGLLSLLLANETIKKHFFKDIQSTLVFDKIAFQRFVSNKKFLPDSYTAFKNKIGLTTNREYLTENKEVVLSWPYKDCVLEGGQTKEDQKRKEIFWNETLAPDEIDRLLAPKALTNFKKYDKDGEHKVDSISLNDNLIIKGNNLLTLHSLKKQYAGKVKLIYIDPPYNTGNDSFGYNDSFNHSTWLTFMKNRLEVAKELLRDDGCLVINIDQNESHYLKVICDSIFGRENLINEVIWAYGTGGNYANSFSKKHDNILIFSKNQANFKFYKEKASIERDICEACNSKIEKRNNLKKHIDESGRVFRTIKSAGKIYKYYDDEPIPLSDVWYLGQMQQQDPERLGFNSQKPEKLLQRIILSTTIESDIVLDYHIGTGTTCAVAHKLGRRYIGIEQMDYIQDLTIKRLKAVIDGEDVGISKVVGWQGGGSFTYCELTQHNSNVIDSIEQAHTTDALTSIWNEIENTDFISYKIKPESINENIKEFEALSLEEQKQFLIAILDKNQLYVNYSEIEDEDYQISEEDKKLNKQFYGEV